MVRIVFLKHFTESARIRTVSVNQNDIAREESVREVTFGR